MTTNSASNVPKPGGYYFVLQTMVIANNENFIIQLAWYHDNVIKMNARIKWNGFWEPWESKII